MQYMGGKAKIARRVVQAIMADTADRRVWYEPFVGGGNVLEYAAPNFRISVASDAHEDLILMWRHVSGGGDLPEFVSREEYQALRHAEPSWLRGYAGFGASFGGKWFGGYGVSPRDGEVVHASRRAVRRQAEVFAAAGVRFVHAPFGVHHPPAGTVVYCDPPYAGTTGYDKKLGSFDYRFFYETLMKWAVDSSVYVSEYAIPAWVSAREIWSREKRNVLDGASNNRVAVERLFKILPNGD